MAHDVIVIGAGHNGLVCAAYLARAGLDVVVVEARDSVGGAASTVSDLGARFNICNCDHIMVRATPILDELALAEHGLRYLDVEPAQVQLPWHGEAAWPVLHDVDRTVDALRRFHPAEADGYRAYARDAVPVAELILEVAAAPPTPGPVLRAVAARRARGVANLLRFSRTSAADVLRRYFLSEAILGPAVSASPAAWGLPPTFPGSGLAALSFAMKHVAPVGRPVGGSGALTDAVAASLTSAGGTIRTGTRVAAIVCEGDRVRGVETDAGEVVDGRSVVVACDPRRAIVRWLRGAPAAAGEWVRRWEARHPHDGYESKLDGVVAELPRFRQVDDDAFAELGIDQPLAATVILGPTMGEVARAHAESSRGRVAERPIFFVNLPSVLDETMRVPGPDGGHVLSVEALYTPYALDGGWPGSPEPARWLDVLATALEPGFEVRRWRAVTPDVYESDFGMPRGYATSFAGGPVAALLGRGGRELTRYETPVPGLYLTGAAAFPGAGIWGASGRNAAHVVLARA